MKKILLFTILLLFPILATAQSDQVFKAEVLEIVDEERLEREDGTSQLQQDIKLVGLEGEFGGEEFMFFGIGSVDVVSASVYKEGDKVLVVANYTENGELSFYIMDHVRNTSLAYLFLLFLMVLVLVGRWKGLRAFISLAISFLVIVYYIIPQIISGADAVIVTIIGSLAILLAVIYITEGWNKKSHVASLSIFISLIFTVVLAWLFVELAKLSGLGSEEIAFLVSIDNVIIDFKGLLLAGIIIGTLGVLDDVIIAQVATVEQLCKTAEGASRKEIFISAYEVGVSHIASMANTLFLAYTGASLPLLILFLSGGSVFTSFSDVLNNELIATEVVRTLSGSIGLILAVPISTYLAATFYVKK